MISSHDLVLQYHAYKTEINSAIERVLNSGQYILGNEVAAFEHDFAEYLSTRYAVGVASGTDGLILALLALGIGNDDEVITSPYTPIPVIAAIHAVRAYPVFVDVHPETYLIDSDLIAAAVTPRTKAMITVHLFGNMVDIHHLRNVIGNNIPIIEDACQAHGSTLGDAQAGTIGDIGVFSFYPTKNLGCYGDGGMVVTNHEHLNDKLRILRIYGMPDSIHATMQGINSRLDELQAAILRVKLKRLDEMNKKRQIIASRYREMLRPGLLDFQVMTDKVHSNYHVFACRFKQNRKSFIDYLASNDIQLKIYYPIPVYNQRAYNYLGIKNGQFPVTEGLCDEVIALPIYPEMEQGIQDRVISTINAYNG